jgi:LmbE family N-acetylglucosaminyl deacetylase
MLRTVTWRTAGKTLLAVGFLPLIACGPAGGPLRAAPPPAPAAPAPLDLLVLAPHSDDEAIGCAGLMFRAIADGKRVGVVVVTQGDGFPKAAAAAARKEVGQLRPEDFLALARMRQRHTFRAMEKIGVRRDDVHFLGYPDSGLTPMYQATDATPFRQKFTGKSETYPSEVPDYHSQRHVSPAPYRKEAVIADLAEIIAARKPQQIYVTHEADVHPDHRATFWFARDAARAAGVRQPLLTFVVHGKPPPREPAARLALTPAEQVRKRELLELYQKGVSPVHDTLAEEYTRPEEVFWSAAVE